MPELPDLTVYLDALEARVVGRELKRVVLRNPFLLRTYEPPLDAVHGKRVLGLRRIGKRIVFALEDELFVVIHLMVAGRLHWLEPGGKRKSWPGTLATFEFDGGTLAFTEAGSKR